jgi:hypothetical protein
LDRANHRVLREREVVKGNEDVREGCGVDIFRKENSLNRRYCRLVVNQRVSESKTRK